MATGDAVPIPGPGKDLSFRLAGCLLACQIHIRTLKPALNNLKLEQCTCISAMAKVAVPLVC